MKELSPHVVISAIGNADMQRAQNLLDAMKNRLQTMGIVPLFVPQNFSHEEIMQWVKDVTSPEDFYINFTFDIQETVFFRDAEEEQMAKIFSNELSFRMDTPYQKPAPLFNVTTDEAVFLSSLPLHTWDIHIDGIGKTNTQIEMNMMASITDLYFFEHDLLPQKSRWPFRDVPSTHFASKAITLAKQKNIIPGYKGDILRPNGGVTRGELIHILHQLGNF